MLEFLDDYILETLQTEWQKLVGKPIDDNGPARAAASLAVWKKSFSTAAIQKHIEDAYKVFVTDGRQLIFYEAWNPTLFTLEQYTVAVSLDAQGTDGELFGHGNAGGVIDDGEDGDSDDFASPQSGTVGLYILCPKKRILSFIAYFIRRAILCASIDINHDLGIDNAHNIRSAALICPPEMAPNGVPVIYGRKLELDVECIDVATRLGGGTELEQKPVLVHEEGDGIDALVDRATGTETALGATIFGEVKPRPVGDYT